MTDPAKAKPILARGRFVSAATAQAIGLTTGVCAGFGGCWNHGSGFWDPFHGGGHGFHHWNGCWSLGLWWGWGFGFGFHTNCFAFGFWESPWWWDAPVYYAGPPVYYSSVIYDAYAPPPQQVVAYPSAEAPAVGEGSIQADEAPGDRATENGLAAPRGLLPLPSAANRCLTLGDEAFRAGRYIDSVHEYARAVEIAPDRGVLHLILSDGLLATGDYHYSAYALRRALELDPTLVDSVLDKHSFYGDPADFDNHLEALERYASEHPQDDDAKLLLAANDLFANRAISARDILAAPSSAAVRESAAGRIIDERVRKTLSESKPK